MASEPGYTLPEDEISPRPEREAGLAGPLPGAKGLSCPRDFFEP